ncbi:Hypothetical predicted protein [Mytilus galloprovincialis]|uniref:C-type lectin domain-containing protein n=1 Tax=Mytilus galloprovincialis TaxID=29158 RepID=A0A8B6DRA7_MYTGA|nr:Hypothetical predicted protein [Mytilus galloprovincialis]
MRLQTVFFHINLLIKIYSGTTIISAHHKPEADGKFGNQTNDETMFSISIAECNMRCSLNSRCVSFFYNSLTKLCILHSNPFTYTVIPNLGTGWKLYVTRDRTGRCPDNFFFYRQLDFCYQFRPTIQAAYISCPLGKLQRIDTEEKQNYTMKITADIELVYNAAICIQGKNTGTGWKFLDGTLMTYSNWGWNQPFKNSNQLRMIRWKNYVWATTSDTVNCSYLCEYP